jgi:hypothetical protein
VTKGFITNTDSSFTAPGNNLDGLDFPTETTIDPAAQLRTGRHSSGANSRTKGYAAARFSGYQGTGFDAAQSLTTGVDGLVFATQTLFTSSATSGARGAYGATNSETQGFWAGGCNFSRVTSSLVDGLDFPTETSLSTSASVRTRYKLEGVSSASKGYYAGGNDFGAGYGTTFNEVDGIIFSNRTSVNPAMGLATTRWEVAGVNSSTNGYWCGGGFNQRDITVYSEIDGISFATETLINPAAGLAVARSSAAGLNSSTRGYVCGGYNRSSTNSRLRAQLREIDGIEFATETQINPSAALVIAKEYMASFQDYSNNP